MKSSDGFNLNLAVPFKFEDLLFGFRYSLDNVSGVPESLFFRKSLDTPQEGVLTVDGDFVVGPNKLGVAARWVSNKLGLSLGANADSQSYLTNVDASKSLSIDGKKVTVSGAYDVKKNKAAGGIDVAVDATTVSATYDSEENDVALSVSHQIDEQTVVTPSINSKVQFGLALLRKWNGGRLRGKYSYPQDKVDLEWTDDGANGAWVTKAEIPVRNAKQTKVSLSRDWTY